MNVGDPNSHKRLLKPTGYRKISSPKVKWASESSPAAAERDYNMSSVSKRSAHLPSASPFPSSDATTLSTSPSKANSDLDGKKSSWMNATTKKLGFSKRKEKHLGRVFTPNSAAMLKKELFGSSPSLEQPTSQKRPPSADHPAAPSPKSPKLPSHLSPQDKPLPSLPVVSITQNASVRRSLIDCPNGPLRRSITPPESDETTEEDWPAISPEKIVDGAHRTRVSSCQIKPSIGESVIEGMRTLNLIEATATDDEASPLKSPFDDPEDSDVTEKRKSRPLSSSQLPKPQNSMLESLSRHNESSGDHIRQTKASALRLRQSIGKHTWSPADLNYGKQSSENSASSSLIPTPTTQKLARPGLGHNDPRKTHGVTRSGSPYTVANLSKSRPDRTTKNVNNNPFAHSEDSDYSEQVDISDDQAGLSYGKNTSTNKRSPKRSSLPLPSRILQYQGSERHQGQNTLTTDTSAYLSIASPVSSRAAEFDCATPGTVSRFSSSRSVQEPSLVESERLTVRASQHETLESMSKQYKSATHTEPASQLLSVQEVLSTQAPGPDERALDDDVSEGSVQGYDAVGSLRIKRVRTKRKNGPTMRIRESAEKVIMGAEPSQDDNLPGSPNGSSESEPGSRGSVVMRKNLNRPFSGLFERVTSVNKTRARSYAALCDNLEDSSDYEPLLDDPGMDPKTFASKGQTERFPSLHNFVQPEARPENTIPASEKSTELRASAEEHGDWPGKAFDALDQGPITSPTLPSAAASDGNEIKVKENQHTRPQTTHAGPPHSSKPPTIIVKEEPSRVTAPFLYQNPETARSIDSQAALEAFRFSFAKSAEGSSTSQSLLPRRSSRKSKPPPISVAPPEAPAKKPFAFKSMKAYGVDPGILEKPRNVSTFSQSLSATTSEPFSAMTTEEQGNGSASASVLTKASSNKKPFSNIRGFFHKKTVESSDQNTAGIGRMQSLRRKPGQTAKSMSSQHTPSYPPTSVNKTPTRLCKSDTTIRNPFASPVTPFTATGEPSPSPMHSSRVPTQTKIKSSNPLATITTLTHALLDLADAETSKTRKSALLTLSKSMVTMVNTASEVAKHKEEAAMLAQKAEMAYLKVCKEVAVVEGTVKKWLGTEMRITEQ